ncbi:MAG: FixH family protein [Henriciella sp.]
MSSSEALRSEKTLTGWHVLASLFGFFGVMFAVNGVFLYHAITSFPGEDTKKSYVQGLNYNDTLAVRAQQAELGWTAQVGLSGKTLIVRLSDAQKTALSGHLVIGELRRRATTADDQLISFRGSSSGEYSADVSSLQPGQWDVRIRVLDPNTEAVLFRASKGIMMP